MEIKLNAETRAAAEKLAVDTLPAVVYGPGMETISLKINKVDLEKAVVAAGESNLIDLMIDGKTSVKVLIKETQYSPLKGILAHADFYKVDMKKTINTEIPLHFIGESKAVKELGAMLVKSFHHIEVECLPNDLVDHIDVDISALVNVHDSIIFSDLKLPASFEVDVDPETVIITALEPKVEVVAPAPVAEATPAEGATAPVAAKTEEKK